MRIVLTVFALALSAIPAAAELSVTQRQEIIRAITAEYGTAKVIIPRSKKPLPFRPGEDIDSAEWGEAYNKFGPAARVGDIVQVTRVEFKGDRVVL